MDEFLAMALPEREFILAPILLSQGLVLLYANGELAKPTLPWVSLTQLPQEGNS